MPSASRATSGRSSPVDHRASATAASPTTAARMVQSSQAEICSVRRGRRAGTADLPAGPRPRRLGEQHAAEQAHRERRHPQEHRRLTEERRRCRPRRRVPSRNPSRRTRRPCWAWRCRVSMPSGVGSSISTPAVGDRPPPGRQPPGAARSTPGTSTAMKSSDRDETTHAVMCRPPGGTAATDGPPLPGHDLPAAEDASAGRGQGTRRAPRGRCR